MTGCTAATEATQFAVLCHSRPSKRRHAPVDFWGPLCMTRSSLAASPVSSICSQFRSSLSCSAALLGSSGLHLPALWPGSWSSLRASGRAGNRWARFPGSLLSETAVHAACGPTPEASCVHLAQFCSCFWGKAIPGFVTF